jgi:hypothetical protein
MSKSIFVVLAVAGLLLGGCASQPEVTEPLVITKKVEDHLQKYLAEVAAGRQGAFAVTLTGNSSYYSVCESGACNGQFNFSNEAIRGCENYGQGRCVVLSSNGIIRHRYIVEGTSAAAMQQSEVGEPVQFVSGEQIRQELIGNSIVEQNSTGKTWVEYFDPNGAVRGRSREGTAFSGAWTITGNTLCVDYTSIGEDWCGQFAEGSDGSIDYYRDGKFRKTYPRSVLQSGNPQKL